MTVHENLPTQDHRATDLTTFCRDHGRHSAASLDARAASKTQAGRLPDTEV